MGTVRIGPCPSEPLVLRLKPVTYVVDGITYQNCVLEPAAPRSSHPGFEQSSAGTVMTQALGALASFPDGASLTDWSRTSDIPTSTLSRHAEKWVRSSQVQRREDKKYVLTLGAQLFPPATTTHPL
jgi:hypothetical protein